MIQKIYINMARYPLHITEPKKKKPKKSITYKTAYVV